ncbi:MAG: hypothetical protein V7731_23390 [Amphritea sp.]
MATSNTTISRLRQRFIDDMSLRKLAPKRSPVTSGLLKTWHDSWAVPPIPRRLKICADSSCRWLLMASRASPSTPRSRPYAFSLK